MDVRNDAYDGGPFYHRITIVAAKHPDRDLEEWLLALYRLVLERRDEALTLEGLIELLDAAFTVSPAPFDQTWLEITDPPDDLWLERKFTNPDLGVKPDPAAAKPDGYEFALNVLRFQAAELHRMRGKQLDNDYRYFGVTSDTGNSWYNFDPKSILECGAAGMGDRDAEIDDGWYLLGDLLETGRIYE